MIMIKIIEVNDDLSDEEIIYDNEITQEKYEKIMEVLNNESD